MVIDNKLLKEFAQITNDSEVKTENPYLRGTIVSNTDGKYVQLDGSTTITPISELVNVEEGDRVLVSIENHKATIIGNFTFPPSARKEQEALDQAGFAQESANNANNTANVAQEKAQEASSKADTAISQSSVASASADEAKQQAKDAIATANTASTNASEAKSLATQASTEATEAKQQAAASQAASADAQAEVTKLQNEVKDAQEDADKALADLETQAGEISSIKETYATKVEVGNTKAELETTITTKVGELETTVSQTYSTKTENVELEGRLQSQITQNAEGLASQVIKTEKLESDTAKAQEDVDEALRQAAAAQSSADNAQSTANAAQTAANNAQTAADSAAQKATTAQNAADLAQAAADAADEKVQAAQSDLNEAKQNLESVTSRVDATEADIADAQAKVDTAQTNVNQALADAAEANLAATKAQEAADKAQQDAETAQGAANTAQQKADNAQTAANNAQSAADKAQADVAALTSRVSTAETTISQNSENITLNANKITEIGNQADSTDTNLANNYYTKTETDAKIEIESDRITSTVTRVETVENKAVVSSIEEFYLSTSPTELTGGSWSTSQPTWTEGMYIWRRTYVTKGDGTTSYQPNQNGVCITGNTGESAPEIETIKSFDGDLIILNDSSNYELMNLKLYGKTIQYIISGKNKFDLSRVRISSTSDGVSLNDTGITLNEAWGNLVLSESDTSLLFQTNTDYICTAIVKVIEKEDEVSTIERGILYLSGSSDIKVLHHPDYLNWKKGETHNIVWEFTTPDDFTGYDLRASCYVDNGILEITNLMIRLANETDDTYEPYGTDVSPSLESPSDIINVGDSITVKISSDAGEQSATFPMESEHLMEGSYLADDGIHHTRRKLFLAVSDMNNTESQPGWTNITELKTDYPDISGNFSEVTNYLTNIYMNNSDKISIDTTSDNATIYFNDDLLTQSQFKTNYPDLVIEIEYEMAEPNGTQIEEIIPYTETQQIAWTELQSLHTYIPNTIIQSSTRFTGEYYTTYKGDKGDDGATENLAEITDNINARIDEAQSTIDQLSNMISQLITDSNGGSLMTQTPDGWTFNMSSINDNLTAIKDAMANMENEQNDSNSALEKLSNLVNDVANKTAYITMSTDDNGDPCIELGKSDSLFKVRITNIAIDFLEGSTRIAYANNKTFYSEKIIANEVQIGKGPGFSWKTRPNGNCGLTPVKG